MQRLRASGAGQFARRRATMPARMPVRSQTHWTLAAATCAIVVASFLLHRDVDAPPMVPLHVAMAERERAPSHATRPSADVAMPSAVAAPADHVRGAFDDGRGTSEHATAQRPHALT